MMLAVAAAVIWFIFGPQPAIIYALIVFVTTLIIACPCALGLATPTSLTVGIGKGAEQGILIRSGDALQTTKRLQVIALDKTGTITRGKPALTSVVAESGFDEDDVLRLAAAVERNSEHPLAGAIVEGATAQGIVLVEAKNFREVPGQGVEGFARGRLAPYTGPASSAVQGSSPFPLCSRLSHSLASMETRKGGKLSPWREHHPRSSHRRAYEKLPSVEHAKESFLHVQTRAWTRNTLRRDFRDRSCQCMRLCYAPSSSPSREYSYKSLS